MDDISRIRGLVPSDYDDRPHNLSECAGMQRTHMRTDGLRIKTECGSKRALTLGFPPGSRSFVMAQLEYVFFEDRALRYIEESSTPGFWEYFTVPINNILKKNNCEYQPTHTHHFVYAFAQLFGICPFCCFPITSRKLSLYEEQFACLVLEPASDQLLPLEESANVPTQFQFRPWDVDNEESQITIPEMVPSRAFYRRLRKQRCVFKKKPPPPRFEYHPIELFSFKVLPYERDVFTHPIDLDQPIMALIHQSRHEQRTSTSFLSQCGSIPLLASLNTFLTRFCHMLSTLVMWTMEILSHLCLCHQIIAQTNSRWPGTIVY